MKKIGRQVWWSMPDNLRLSPSVLSGFRVPGNGPRTALIKACKAVKKEFNLTDDFERTKTSCRADHKTFKRDHEETRIALVVPVTSSDGKDFQQETALIAILDNRGGGTSLKFEVGQGSIERTNRMIERIKEEYAKASGTLATDQIRSVINGYLKLECSAVSLKRYSGGNPFFVPADYEDGLEKIKELIAATKGAIDFRTTPIFDEPEWNGVIQDSVAEDLMGDFDELVKMLDKQSADGYIGEKALEGRIDDAIALTQRIDLYEEQLRSKYDGFKNKADAALKILEDKLLTADDKKVAKFDLAAELAAIKLDDEGDDK